MKGVESSNEQQYLDTVLFYFDTFQSCIDVTHAHGERENGNGETVFCGIYYSEFQRGLT